MKKHYLALSISAGLLGGFLSSALRPAAAQAQAQPFDEIRAQRFTLVNQNGVPMGTFSFDHDGQPQIVLRDTLGHEVWKLTAAHPADRAGQHAVNGHFDPK